MDDFIGLAQTIVVASRSRKMLLLSLATQLQHPLPLSILHDIWQAVRSPEGVVLAVCLIMVGILSLAGQGHSGKLATGRWAKSRECLASRRLALRQMKARVHNEIALSIGLPRDGASHHLPDVQRGVVVIGAPGSGKTFSIINPLNISALLQGFPLIVYDFKYPGQGSSLAPLAQHLGYDVHIFAPGYPESDVCNLLDFMQGADDAVMARQLAKVLYRNAQQSGTSRADDSFFSDAGEQLTVATLALAKTTPYPDLMMAQAILRLPGLATRLQRMKHLPLWSRLNFDQLTAVEDSEKTAASIIGTAAGYFTRFMAPSLLGAFVGSSTLPLDLTGRQMIIIGMDKERRDVVGPLAATVLHMLITRNVSQPRYLPLIVSVDELPTLYLPNLVNWINQHREQGLALILGAQNLAQLEKAYDRATARAIFGACATKVMFNPGEPDSAQHFAHYLGEEEVRYTEISRNHNGGRTTVNRSQQRRTRNLFEPGQFLKLPTGTAVLISPGLANRRETALPRRLNVRVPATITQMLKVSRASWQRLRLLLIQRSQQQIPGETDLQARIAHAETLLPPVISEL
ncbi:MAG: type IV secretion system DNA-binding domain-containing protein [Cyanobacteria bacterium P01_A01_bin.17]